MHTMTCLTADLRETPRAGYLLDSMRAWGSSRPGTTVWLHKRLCTHLVFYKEHRVLPIENPDWVVINTSAGKDSQAMTDYVVDCADKAGVPRERLVMVHADLGDMEWPGTKELAAEHAAHYGLRFEVVHRVTAAGERQNLLQQVEARGKWPSSTCRYCTSDHKRGPVGTLLTRLVTESRATGIRRRVNILNCLGLRADESPARAKRQAVSQDKRSSNGRRLVTVWLPIHGWDEASVWARIEAAGTRAHPAYRRLRRLSCSFCIFSPPDALVIAGQERPDLLDRYVEVEQKIGHRFRIELSMAEVRERVRSGCVPERCDGTWCM